MTPLWVHKADSMWFFFVVVLTSTFQVYSPSLPLLLLHNTCNIWKYKSCKYSLEEKPPYYRLCLNIPRVQKKRQSTYNDIDSCTFSMQSLTWGSIQENPSFSSLFCFCCLSSSSPWSFVPLPPPHISSPHQCPGSVLGGGWYSLRFSCRS